MLALDFALISAVHKSLHVVAVWVIKKIKDAKHPFPSICPIWSVAALLSYQLYSALSCFRLHYNLVLGHVVGHSAWNLTNAGGGRGRINEMSYVWKEFKVGTHLRVAFLIPKVAPRVYKAAKANSYFVSLLVSLSSGEKFSALSRWKRSGCSLVSNIPPPTSFPLSAQPLPLSLNCTSTQGSITQKPREAALPLSLILDSACAEQTSKESRKWLALYKGI